MIESLRMSIFTLETEAARASSQRIDRLASADRMISSLHVTIQEQLREIYYLSRRLAEARSQHASLRWVGTAYHLHLMGANMAP